MFDPITILVAGIICVPALAMALRGSPWIIDYLFFVVALNRGIRRIVDYYNGYFNSHSFISLTPIIVGGLASLVVIGYLSRPGNSRGASSQVLIRYCLAIGLAFIVGFTKTKFGAIYALGEYVAPIGLIGLGAMHSSDEAVIGRWCNSMALSAVVVAVYGIFQFYTIPPWDAFWVQAANFEGYLGYLEPTKMTLFSTMAERGPCATYLCSGLLLLLLRPKTLGIFRLPCALFVAYAMLLTYSRTAVIQTGLACILFPLLNRGSGIVPVGLLCLVVFIFGERALQSAPGMGMASQRVSTIGAISEDGSFQGRLILLQVALARSFSEPIGVGIGAHGEGWRISGLEAQEGIGDSTGYVEALRTFGWIGFLIIVSVLWRTWCSSSIVLNFEKKFTERNDENVFLFRAWFVSGMVALFSGSWIFTATFFWVLAGYCLGRADEIDEIEESEMSVSSPRMPVMANV